MSRRFRRLYRPRAAPPLEFGFRNPETNDLTAPNTKQAAALASGAEHIFYGGAVGGGKTVWLVVVAIMTCLLHPGVHVAIFRRHYKELQQNVVSQFFALLPPRYVKFNRQLGMATFPNGSVCWFGHCARESDVYLYQGNQWVKLLIDEASHLTKFIVGYLSTRVRSPRRDVFLQLLMGSNPGGPGHGFLKHGWVQPDGWEISHLGRQPQPMEVWRPRPPRDRPNRYMATRQFVPAYFHDNVVLASADPFYLDRVISALPGVGGGRDSAKGKQLAEGDWTVNEGMMFGEDWESSHTVTADDTALVSAGLVVGMRVPWHVKPIRNWVPHPSAKIYGSIDYGYGAPFSFHLHAVMPGNHVRTFRELYRAGVRDRDQARWIRKVVEDLMARGMAKPTQFVYDPQMDGGRAEVGITESISDIYDEELFSPLQILGTPAGREQNARLSRIQRVKDALAPMADGFPHWDITEDCENLVRTLPDLPTDPDAPEYIDEDAEDHAYEDCGRFFQSRPAPPRVTIPTELDDLDPLSRAEQLWRAKRLGEVPTGIPHLDVRGLTNR